jgi:hypothetical protein
VSTFVLVMPVLSASISIEKREPGSFVGVPVQVQPLVYKPEFPE